MCFILPMLFYSDNNTNITFIVPKGLVTFISLLLGYSLDTVYCKKCIDTNRPGYKLIFKMKLYIDNIVT